MRALLDTCTLLWLVGDPEQLSATARARVTSEGTERYVSAISAFEIAVKHRRGKLDLPLAPQDWWREAISTYGLRELPVTAEIAAMAPQVDVPHRDPCDRMLIATAQAQGIAIVTPDPLIRACPDIEVTW